jgi:hypothetical protein
MSGEFDNSFDIFRGTLNDSPVWVENADGFRIANKSPTEGHGKKRDHS